MYNSAPNLDLLGCRCMKYVPADKNPHKQSVLFEIVASDFMQLHYDQAVSAMIRE